MIFSENRYPPRIQVRGRLFPDHALDAERAAQTIATPESVSLVFAPNARRVFRKNGHRSYDRNTRQIISDAFSNGSPVSTSPENATSGVKFRLTLFLQPNHGFGESFYVP
jgi:hypothetical protein